MEALDVGGYVLVSLAALVFLFLQSWFAATVVCRVVGVPTGWPRTLAVGLVMSAVVAVTVQYLYRAGTGHNVDGLDISPGVAVLFTVLALGWIFALGVAALVMLEAAFPTGSLPSPQSLFFGWKSRRRRGGRYAQVVSIAVRHGLGSQLRGFGGDSPGRDVKTARALKESLAEAGVTFVKLGQMLSTRRDILPPVFVRELETLQTQVTPEPWSVIEPAIAERLGRPIGEVFARIGSTPLAAASVAQVHEATLLDGTEVIVKVQRPKALNQVTQDLDIILRLAGWLNKTTTWGRDLGVQSLATGFANTLEEELDYRIELDNMASTEALSNGRGSSTSPFRTVIRASAANACWSWIGCPDSRSRGRGRCSPSSAVPSGPGWRPHCWVPRSSRSSGMGSSTPICMPATSSSLPTGNSAFSTSVPSVGSAQPRRRLWASCSIRSIRTTAPGPPTPSSNSSGVQTGSTIGGGRTGRRRTPAALRRRHPCGTGSEALRRSVQSRARAPVLRAGTDQRRIPGDGLRRGCAADDRPALRRRRRVPAGGQQAREVEAQGHEDHR